MYRIKFFVLNKSKMVSEIQIVQLTLKGRLTFENRIETSIFFVDKT